MNLEPRRDGEEGVGVENKGDRDTDGGETLRERRGRTRKREGDNISTGE